MYCILWWRVGKDSDQCVVLYTVMSPWCSIESINWPWEEWVEAGRRTSLSVTPTSWYLDLSRPLSHNTAGRGLARTLHHFTCNEKSKIWVFSVYIISLLRIFIPTDIRVVLCTCTGNVFLNLYLIANIPKYKYIRYPLLVHFKPNTFISSHHFQMFLSYCRAFNHGNKLRVLLKFNFSQFSDCSATLLQDWCLYFEMKALFNDIKNNTSIN